MNADKKLRAELDRFYLSTLVKTLSTLSSEKEYDIRKYIARSMHIDISTLNNFLAGRSQSLAFEAWPKFLANKFKNKNEVMYEGKGARDLIHAFNSSAEERWMVFPITCATDDSLDVPEFIQKLISWSIATINGIWDETGGGLDVRYWTKIIELFPWRLVIDSEYFVSLFCKEADIQQMICELEAKSTELKNIPRELLGEFVELEAFVKKYEKKSSVPKGTSQRLIQELKEQGTSIMRLKRFAECSPIFRLYSIRAIDIHLYSLIYCLTADEQAETKKLMIDISRDGTKHRKPDMV